MKSKSRRSSADDIPPPEPGSKSITITEVTGDIFDAPENALLIHACNCMGSWGAGIAAAFKERYPGAFSVYHKHCADTANKAELVGTALLIPPCEKGEDAPQHWIGCLFTSRRFGRGKDAPKQIVENTGPAMHALMEQVAEEADGAITEARMCRINAGKFGVPWQDTKAAIVELVFGDESIPTEVVVYERE